MSEDITVYLCRSGKSAVVSKGVRVDVLGSGEAVQVSTDEDGRTVVEVVLLRRGQKPVREVVARLFKSVGDPPEFAWPEITLAFEPTFPDLVDSTWDITFTTPDYCRYFGWGLYRWSGAPGACCSNFDIPIALEVPGLPNSAPLPLSRSDAAPKAGKKHSIQLIDDPPFPGDLYCLYGNVVLPADDEGNLVYYPLASVVFGTNCFTGGVVREVIETDAGYEYMVQSAARAENGHALDVLRVRPSDNRRYNVGEWVTIHVDSAQCRHARPGIDTVWVVADDTASGGRVPNVVPLSPGGSRTGVTGCGGSIDYGSLGQGAMQRARVYTGMIIEIHRDRDPVVADVYLAAFGRVDGVKFYYHCEADNDRSPSDAKFMADAHSAFEADDIVRVLHVSGRRFETEAVTADALKIIGFADGKPRPCVKQFLLFYRSGGAAKMASFDFTGGQMSVIRHGDADAQGFAGIAGHMVTYEKELRPSGADSTSILMGVPFEIADDGWMYTGFDPVYTDPWIFKYKFDDPDLATLEMTYGIYDAKNGIFQLVGEGGNPYAGAGFGYDADAVSWYSGYSKTTSDYIRMQLFVFDIHDNFSEKYSRSIEGHFPPHFVGGDGTTLIPMINEFGYDGLYSGAHVYVLAENKLSAFCYNDYYGSITGQHGSFSRGFMGDTGCPCFLHNTDMNKRGFVFEGDIASFSCYAIPNRCPVSMHSIDGRCLGAPLSGEDQYVVRACRSGWATYDAQKSSFTYDKEPFALNAWSEPCTEGGSIEHSPHLYKYEANGRIDHGRLLKTLTQTYTHFSGSEPEFLGSYHDFHSTAVIRIGDRDLASTEDNYRDVAIAWGYDGHRVYFAGDRASVFPMSIPVGLSENDLFALKTLRSFAYARGNFSREQFPSSMERSLITPHEDEIPLDLSSRPMGWTQIQTEDNEHVLQGVLIINDETSAVKDAMLWHNGTRIEAALAAAVGCEVTDLLGVLYIPKVSVGGESSELPADEETSNGPSGYRDFCTAYPDHPACVYNGCTSMEYSEDLLNTLQEINDAVNAAHTYETDELLYKKLEFWSVMGDGESGDCEDFALTKVGALIAAGIPAGAIKLVIGKAGNGEGHAWVEVQTTNGNYSLDINYTEVQPTSSLPYTDVQRQYDGPWWV